MSSSSSNSGLHTVVIPGWGDGEIPPPRNWAPLIIAGVMLLSAWTTMILRLYTRIYLVYAFGWDDIFMILALFSFSVYAGGIMDIAAVDSLLDHMSYEALISSVKGLLLALIFYVVTITFIKLSLGIFLVRIVNRRSHKILIYIVMAVSTVWGTASALVAVFQCGYPSSAKYYIEQRLKGTCISGDTAVGVTYAHAVVSAASDVIFTTLPLFILRDAQINRRAKIVLGTILMLGAIGSVASLVRFVYIKELKTVTVHFFLQCADLSNWSTLECGLGISAGSLATLRPMFRKLLQGARTIGQRTVDTISGGSGRNNTNRGNDSRHKSFAKRFSLNSKRATMSTAKRLSDQDLEAYSPPIPLPNHGISEKSYNRHGMGNDTFVSVTSLPPVVRKPQSPREVQAPSHNWPHDNQPRKDTTYQTVTEAYEPNRAYNGRNSSHSSRYSQSHHSREHQTWI